jgi:hypothetical protein
MVESLARSLRVVEEPRSSRRRVKVGAELTRQLRDLDPEERRRRVLAYMEEHGEDVGPDDGYGPRIGERDRR